ncbi:MAG: OmpA family protein [Polyangiaceae bacterium]|nr:OmpA family protein [Polyangiaceae bacterium]
MNKKMGLVAAVLLAAGWVCSCGYSEDEWQAQLAKQHSLEAKNSELEEQLAKARSRADKLAADLEKMGVQLNAEGTAKQAMAKDIEQMKQALEEYRQRAQLLERIKQRFEVLRKKLTKLTNLGLDVRIRNNRMVISLPGDVLFASGEDTLREDGQKILAQVADVIRGDDSLRNRLYQVAGHTDNMPLKRTASVFHDNWGLSVMRARQVLVYLVTPTDAKAGGGGLSPKLWSASGYGDTDPVTSNDTPEGRSKNRRVELVLLPDVEEMLDLKSLL